LITDRAGEAIRPSVESEGIARNTAFALAITVLFTAFGAALHLFLVRALSPEGYGLFALAVATGALVALPLDLGISASAGRFVAEHRGERSAIAGIVADSLKLKLVVSGLASVVLFALAGPIGTAYGEPDLEWPLRGIALAVFAASILQLFSAVLIAQGKIGAGFPVVIAQNIGVTGATIALVLLGAGAAGAAFGRAAGDLLAVIIGFLVIVRLIGRAAVNPRSPGAGAKAQIARYAGALAVVDGAWVLFNQLDAILIEAFLGSRSVGLFQAPMRLLTVSFHPAGIAASGVGPRIARHAHQPRNVEAFRLALRYITISYAAFLAPLLVWADPIVDLTLGADYEESVSVLRALAPYVFLSGLAIFLSHGANYLGEARRRVVVAIAAVAINLVIDLVLIPKIGIVAGAIGTDVALAVYAPAHLWICRRVIKIPLRPFLLTLLRSLLAAAAMAGVLLSVGTSDLSLTAWLVGMIGGTLAFAGTLLASREVSFRELRLAHAGIRRRLGARFTAS
jgi:O-antigen/teichoic acid export membrane protein